MIALFTDFGMRDAYVAQMKGTILTIHPRAQLLDLNHEVRQFDIRGAAYVLAASARFFPAGAIFVAVVDPGVGSARGPLLLQTGAGKSYIGPDNGLFTHVVEREGLRAAYALTEPVYFREPQISATFHGRDIFAPVAAHLSLGVLPELLGTRLIDIVTLPQIRPHAVEGTVIGEVLHIDHFGNVISNITPDMLDHLKRGQPMVCTVGDNVYTIPFVYTYAEGAPAQLIGLINSEETFELAIAKGHAATFLQAQVGDRVTVEPEGGASV